MPDHTLVTARHPGLQQTARVPRSFLAVNPDWVEADTSQPDKPAAKPKARRREKASKK